MNFHTKLAKDYVRRDEKDSLFNSVPSRVMLHPRILNDLLTMNSIRDCTENLHHSFVCRGPDKSRTSWESMFARVSMLLFKKLCKALQGFEAKSQTDVATLK